MVTIDKITISSYDLQSLTVAWTFEETWESLDPYYINIYRSANDPQFSSGNFELLVSGIDPASINEYEDTTVSGYRTYKWHDFYYSVVPFVVTTNVSGIAGTPARLETELDLKAKEIIRREAIALRSSFGGEKFLVLKRKKTGARCSDCWDDTLQRRTKEDCKTCYDTGWVGGYWEPIEIQGSMGAAPRRTLLNLFGEWETQDTFLRSAPKPLISPQDIIVDIQNRRWRVVENRPIEKGQYIIQQQVRMNRINDTDIIAEYPITWTT
jgi:hypothetical protein